MSVHRISRPADHNVARFACLALAALCFYSPLRAAAQEPTADEIAARMIRGDAFAWEGSRARVRMVLSDKGGKKQERSMEVLGRRDQGLFQTLVRFLAPADVAGTAFLMLERNGKPSEQYVYLSGLKRTRRIVGREQEGSFMGSDFSYADMQPLPKKFAKHTRLPDEKIGESATYVIQTDIAKDAPSNYSKVVAWVRKGDLVALRTRFYDKQGKLQKTLYARRIRDMDGKPVVVEARMHNQQTGHTTDLFIDQVSRDANISASLFTPSALEHF